MSRLSPDSSGQNPRADEPPVPDSVTQAVESGDTPTDFDLHIFLGKISVSTERFIVVLGALTILGGLLNLWLAPRIGEVLGNSLSEFYRNEPQKALDFLKENKWVFLITCWVVSTGMIAQVLGWVMFWTGKLPPFATAVTGRIRNMEGADIDGLVARIREQVRKDSVGCLVPYFPGGADLQWYLRPAGGRLFWPVLFWTVVAGIIYIFVS